MCTGAQWLEHLCDDCGEFVVAVWFSLGEAG